MYMFFYYNVAICNVLTVIVIFTFIILKQNNYYT